MAQWWSNYLDTLKRGGVILLFKQERITASGGSYQDVSKNDRKRSYRRAAVAEDLERLIETHGLDVVRNALEDV
jgi:hypothetical protein